MSFNVAIDGPSGAGKSSLSKEVAKKLGFVYIDTGAIYRTVGLYVYRNNVNPDDTLKVEALLSDIDVSIEYQDGVQHVILNGEDVSDEIRIHVISDYASKVSAIPAVREFLLNKQRELASKSNAIMDGRDIGTVVLPNADLKIYLTASAETRAKRRCLELEEKNQKVSYEQVLKDIIERDKRDMERPIAPLKVAEGAVVVDTSEINFEQSLQKLIEIISEHLKWNSILLQKNL